MSRIELLVGAWPCGVKLLDELLEDPDEREGWKGEGKGER